MSIREAAERTALLSKSIARRVRFPARSCIFKEAICSQRNSRAIPLNTSRPRGRGRKTGLATELIGALLRGRNGRRRIRRGREFRREKLAHKITTSNAAHDFRRRRRKANARKRRHRHMYLRIPRRPGKWNAIRESAGYTRCPRCPRVDRSGRPWVKGSAAEKAEKARERVSGRI